MVPGGIGSCVVSGWVLSSGLGCELCVWSLDMVRVLEIKNDLV